MKYKQSIFKKNHKEKDSLNEKTLDEMFYHLYSQEVNISDPKC